MTKKELKIIALITKHEAAVKSRFIPIKRVFYSYTDTKKKEDINFSTYEYELQKMQKDLVKKIIKIATTIDTEQER